MSASLPAIAIDPNVYRQAEDFLISVDDDWAQLVHTVGPCQHEFKPARAPYEALVRAIAFQQLHAKAGNAILARMLALFPHTSFPTPAQLVQTDAARLRDCGFSFNKIAAIQGIAQAALDGIVPIGEEAHTMTDEALITRLVTLKGVGRWTVEMFLMYTMARMDILPAEDFGVREGYRRLKRLSCSPTRGQILTAGNAWQPYRTIASWYLWRVPAQDIQ